MKITLITAFGDFLQNDCNSSKEFLKEISESNNIHKVILPVGYFRNDFIKPIKKYSPNKLIFLGMDNSIKKPKFETIAKNRLVTLKNPLFRFFLMIYVCWLKLNNKNLRIKKEISKKLLIELPIERNKEQEICLHTIPPKLKEITISNDAGNFVCNYSMWVVENYIRHNKLDTDFYFIHLPLKLNNKQKQELIRFIFK